MADKIVVPAKAIYSPNGDVLATNVEQEEEEWVDPPYLSEVNELQKGTWYVVDEWVFKGHKIRIIGFYDENGTLQSSMYVADHDGSPQFLVKPDEEKGLLFSRMCEHMDVPQHID